MFGWVVSSTSGRLSLDVFLLHGAKVAAVAVIESVARLLPGVLGNEESAANESFTGEMVLEGPHYTRPPEFRGAGVPQALLSGDHARIARWRRRQALLRTRERRPDLFEKLRLSPEDLRLLEREEA